MSDSQPTLPNWTNAQLFVQQKPSEEPVTLQTGDAIYFLKFFHPSLRQPLQYIGTYLASKHVPVSSLFPVVAERLGFPSETQFLVFDEGFSAIQARSPVATHEAAYTGIFLIFQLHSGVRLPDTSYLWAESPVEQNS
jgi:hypothetical protein